MVRRNNAIKCSFANFKNTHATNAEIPFAYLAIRFAVRITTSTRLWFFTGKCESAEASGPFNIDAFIQLGTVIDASN